MSGYYCSSRGEEREGYFFSDERAERGMDGCDIEYKCAIERREKRGLRVILGVLYVW